jgi:PEP-CTERM motif
LTDNLGGPPPFDPAPGEVIYAYQLLNVTAASPGVSNISVGLDVIDIPGLISPPTYISTGAGNEQIPSAGEYNTTSMVWRFLDNPATAGVDEKLNVGEQSPILFFSSQYLPELDNLLINSGLAGSPAYFDSVPSIGGTLGTGVPEPSSLLILIIGSASAFGILRRRVA